MFLLVLYHGHICLSTGDGSRRREPSPVDIDGYNASENVIIKDVMAVHEEFGFINPFHDGNDRVGKLNILA